MSLTPCRICGANRHTEYDCPRDPDNPLPTPARTCAEELNNAFNLYAWSDSLDEATEIVGRHMRPLEQENAKLRAALQRIERWFGEFPETGEFYPNSKAPVSYGVAFGSNGERDFMRNVAREALQP